MTRRIGGSAGSPKGSVHSATPLASIIRSATPPPLRVRASLPGGTRSTGLDEFAGAADPGRMLSPAADQPLPRDHADAGGDDARHGERSDQGAGATRDQLRGGEHRGRRHEPVDQMVDRPVGVVDPEVDAEVAARICSRMS